MITICKYFLLFIIYSFIGWVWEVILSLVTRKKFVNRGFLIGPYCPIYGVGCVLLFLCLRGFNDYPILVFLFSLLICSALEYVTSFIMEKLFKARWWDYSNMFCNINGRICLPFMLVFGILGTLIIYIVNPHISSLISLMPNNLLYAITIILMVCFIIDNIISLKIVFNLKDTFLSIAKDNTEEINKKVHEILLKKTGLSKRLTNAFPNLQIRIKNTQKEFKKNIKKIKKKLKK